MKKALPEQKGYEMGNMTQAKSRAEKFWTSPVTVFLVAFFCCFLWGSASPAIKIGYEFFSIGANDLASRIVFAGTRFCIAGMMVIAFGSMQHHTFLRPQRTGWKYVFVLMLFQTILQYIFFYTGLAHTTGVRGSVINAAGTFFSLFLAAFVFRFEKLTAAKVLGSILGFLGVLIIVTAGQTGGGAISFAGEGSMVIAAFASAVAGCFIKKFSAKENPVTLSGWQFFFGGIVMALAGTAFGGRLRPTGSGAWLLLLYMAFISAGAYTLWGVLLKYNDVSRVTILGFMNPVLGVLLSAAFLGEGQEAFSARVLAALVLVSLGIIISGRKKQKGS
ncbi:MAG: DMT family transporter [Lachnospiraceae bacterium]|nr:DMT family transporter [Lachnospiraceae bacterium]MCI1302339.1 DMT family transporter [Lachnospiraceae bacterium]MCI1331504.1 DMT family transporter [Lachnospiraceae bacterium]MCI1360846.1 DMT family transporter [Lachnospiraceae bacterium]MCI1448325.1 DMT family transporter [Lachnospiraceae bacterium]